MVKEDPEGQGVWADEAAFFEQQEQQLPPREQPFKSDPDDLLREAGNLQDMMLSGALDEAGLQDMLLP